MKVILLKDVRGCGQANTIVEVAQGYALNFLMPHKYAVAATEEKIKEMETKKAQHEAALAKAEEELSTKVKSLEGKTVTIVARATEKGGLFKSLGAQDVAKAIQTEYSLDIPEASITTEPIKTVGEHAVKLASKNSKAQLTVVISAQ